MLQVTLVKSEVSSKNDFNFVAAGDWGCGHEALYTFSMMKSMNPELYLGLGDYSYSNSIDCWHNIVKSVDKNFKIALGNHDTEEKLLKGYMDKFDLKKQYYSFDYDNAHFVALSTELDKQENNKQLKFLTTDLTKNKLNHNIDWTIIFFHRPFYSAGEQDPSEMSETYHPIFEKLDVDLVLQGHSHNYQRTYPLLYNDAKPSEPIVDDIEKIEYHDPNGIIFVTAGTGGESVHSVNKRPFLVSAHEGYGCINVEIKGKVIDVEFYSDTNNTIDEFSITKDHYSKDTDFYRIDDESTK